MCKHAVLVVGSTTIDRIVHPERTAWKLGGVTTYAGLSFQRQNIDTSILSNVAVQDEHILGALSREGLQVWRGDSKKTTHFVNHIKGDERYQELPFMADSIRMAQIAPLLKSIDLLHLGPLFPEDIESGRLWELKDAAPCVSLDLQGYIRKRKRDFVYPAVSEFLAPALQAATFVKADHAELSFILERYDMSLPELLKAFAIREIVVTQGAQGGVVRDVHGNELRYKAHPAKREGDSTGAGDVFFAAYLTQRVFKKHSADDAAELAAETATRQVEGTYITAQELSLSCV